MRAVCKRGLKLTILRHSIIEVKFKAHWNQICHSCGRCHLTEPCYDKNKKKHSFDHHSNIALTKSPRLSLFVD